MAYALGLDAGTTNTCVVADGEVLELTSGIPTFPSIVRVGLGGIFTIPTRGQSPNPHIQHLTLGKRLIGRRRDDGRLSSDVNCIPHAELDKHGAHYKAGELQIHPVEKWAFILGRARRAAEKKHDGPLRQSVLTVPAYYGISQCEAIRSAAEIAGFDMTKTQLVPEPVAIAVDQIELDQHEKTEKYRDASHIVVIDLGGGTFDITEIYIERSKDNHAYIIQAIEGDNFLGGADFDQCLLGLVGQKAKDAGHGDGIGKHELLPACETARMQLTDASVAHIDLPTPDASRPPISVEVTREEFDAACKNLIDKMSELIGRLPIVQNRKRPAAVLLAGGASQMQCVRDLCFKKFPKTEITPVKRAAETVARGAWRIASAENITISDILGKSIRVEAFIPDPTPENKEQRRLATEEVVNRTFRIPAPKKYTFYTKEEGEAEVDLKFLEGEYTETHFNTLIDVMEIRQIPHCEKGTPIEVELDIKGPGAFTVKATVKGRTGNLKVTPKHFLGAETIEAYKITTACRLDGKGTREIPMVHQDGDSSREEAADTEVSAANGESASITAPEEPATNGDEKPAINGSDNIDGTSGSGMKRPRDKARLSLRKRLKI